MRSRYTPHTIRSYFWAIINDGREYLGTKLLKQNFMTGTPAFPSLLLYNILHNIRFQQVTVRNNFPPAWIVQPQVNPPTYQQDATQHQPATQQQKRGNNQGPTAKWGTQPTQQQGGLPPPPTVAKPSSWGNVARQIKLPVEEWAGDQCHPAIIAMMEPLVLKFGIENPSVIAILTASGKTMSNLPRLGPTTAICWSNALVKCVYPRCRWKARGGHLN